MENCIGEFELNGHDCKVCKIRRSCEKKFNKIAEGIIQQKKVENLEQYQRDQKIKNRLREIAVRRQAIQKEARSLGQEFSLILSGHLGLEMIE